MESPHLPPATPFDLPAVTLNQHVPAAGEKLRSESLSRNLVCSGNEDAPFMQVVYGKCRRQRSHEASASVSNADIIINQLPVSVGPVFLFVPTKPDARFNDLNSLHLAEALESLHHSCILEARVNKRKNILAVDTSNGQITRSLLRLTLICGIAVRGFHRSGSTTSVGMLKDVDTFLGRVLCGRRSRPSSYS